MTTCKSDRCYNSGGKLWGGYCFDCYETKCKSCGTTYQKDPKDYDNPYFLSKTPDFCPKCAKKAGNCSGTRGSSSRTYCADYTRKHWHCPYCSNGVMFSINYHCCNYCDDE